MRYRTALDIANKRYGTGYEGASSGRRTTSWRRPATDVNSEVLASGPHLRQSARDLVRNNAWAGSAVRRFTTSAVGTGIVGRPKQDQVNQAWMDWTKNVGAIEPMTFAGFQSLVMRSVIESGSVLVRRELDENRMLKLRVIEPDHLDRSRDVTELDDGGYIYGGIEYDRRERPRAYWLYPRHPGNSQRGVRAFGESVSVPAADILHVYEGQRPSQLFGASWFAPVITKLHEIKDYEDAELKRAQTQSLFGAFVTNLEGDPIGIQKGEDENQNPQLEGLQPGYIGYLQPGEDVTMAQPNVTLGYDQFMRSQLLAVAANFGMSYEVLTGDLSNVNFSSARMGLIEYRARVKEVQNNLMIPRVCAPVFRWFLELVLNRQNRTDMHWYTPRSDAIQPKEDAEATQILVRNGFKSLRSVIEEGGDDFDAHMDDLSEVNEKLDQLKLTLDSDPRKTNKSGAAQSDPNDEPAAPQRPTNGDARHAY